MIGREFSCRATPANEMGMHFRALAFLALMSLEVARADVIDYNNTTGFDQQSPTFADAEIGDDVHRTSSAPISGLDFGYFTYTTAPRTLQLRIYEFEGLEAEFPPPLLGEYIFTDLPGVERARQNIHLDLPNPLAAPAELWVTFRFMDFDTQILRYYPPSVGYTTDYYTLDINSDGILDGVNDAGPVDAFNLAIHTIPEPGTSVIAFWLFSRRSRRV